ncbi:MAG: hypothetical protein ACMUIG_04485 [Thermoplasmatota archaeon]
MLKCPRCGEENNDRELYCGKCQEKLPSVSSLRSTMRSGLEALDRKDFRKALDKFTDIVRQNPGDKDAWFLRSAVLIRMGNGKEAWDDLVEAGLAVETGRCANCRGTGKCKECGGVGICIMCRGTKKCSYCGGMGSCPNCKGVRADDCHLCKGSGECIRCKGTKECTYCSGLGHCGHCKGTGICSHCGGSGEGHEIDISKISQELRELKAWFG